MKCPALRTQGENITDFLRLKVCGVGLGPFTYIYVTFFRPPDHIGPHQNFQAFNKSIKYRTCGSDLDKVRCTSQKNVAGERKREGGEMFLGKGILDNPQMGKTMENENVIGIGIMWRLNRDNIQLLSKLGLLRDHDGTRGPLW